MTTPAAARVSYPQLPIKSVQDKPIYGYAYPSFSVNIANNQSQSYNNNIVPKMYPEQKIPLHVMTTSNASQEKLGSERNPIYPRKRCYNFIDFDYSSLSENNRNYDGTLTNTSTSNKFYPVRIYPTNSTHFQAIPIYYQVKETYGNGVRPILIKKPEQPIKKAKVVIESNNNENSIVNNNNDNNNQTIEKSPPLQQQQQLPPPPPSSPISQVTSQSINSETNTEVEDEAEYADIETEQEDFSNENNSRISSSNENNDIINNSINNNNNNNNGEIISDQELHFFEKLHSCITLDEWNEIIQIFNLFNIEKNISLFEFNNMMTDFLSFSPELTKEFHEIFVKRGMPENIDTSPFEFVSTYVSQCQRIDESSYVTISDECLKPKRTLPESQSEYKVFETLFNNKYVSYPQSCNFRTRDRNEFDDTLTSMEDNKYEIDMKIENLRNTLNRLEELNKEVQEKKDENPQIDRERLTELNRVTISQIYGDKGTRFLYLLLKTPVYGIPIAINQLNNKLQDWLYIRDVFDKEMSRITEKNYLQSYDFRGKNFMEQDKHLTSRNSLLAKMDSLTFRNSFLSVDYHTFSITAESYYELQPKIESLMVKAMSKECGFANRTCAKDFHTFVLSFLGLIGRFKPVDHYRNDITIGSTYNCHPFGVGIITDYHTPYVMIGYETYTIEAYIDEVEKHQYLDMPDHVHCFMDEFMTAFCFQFSLLIERLCKAYATWPKKFDEFLDILGQKYNQNDYEYRVLTLLGNTSFYLYSMPRILTKLAKEIRLFNTSMCDVSHAFSVFSKSIRPQNWCSPRQLYAIAHPTTKKKMFYCKQDVEGKEIRLSFYNINPFYNN